MKKLTRRESILLYFLFILIIFSVSLQFLIFPLVKQNTELNAQVAEKVQAKQLMQEKEANKPVIEKNNEDNRSLLEQDTKEIPYAVNDEDIVSQMTNLIRENGLTAQSVMFSKDKEDSSNPFGKDIRSKHITLSTSGNRIYFVFLLRSLDDMPNIIIDGIVSDYSLPDAMHMVTLTYLMVN